MTQQIIPAESGHWYRRNGTPAYTMIGKNGKERATTLRDARKENLYPSVTSITSILAKPGLENWKMNQVLLSALTLPRNSGENLDDFAKRVINDYREEGRKARERGLEIHAAIESYFAGRSYLSGFQTHILAVCKELEKWHIPNGETWITEMPFTEIEFGYGGKCDLHCIDAIVDFKTTDKPLESLKTWDEHHVQLAAYRKALCPNAKAAIVYVHTDGGVKLIEINEEELARGWEIFKGLLQTWQALKNYIPELF